jgi:hypothetical protein
MINLRSKIKNAFLSLIILTLILITGTIYAQAKQNIFTLKPVIGINVCQIHGDNASGYNKVGINGGIMVNAEVSKRSSFDLGFIFTQKGARKNADTQNGDYTYFRFNLNYLELPILWNFKLNKRYFMTMGPSFAYLINYTETNELGDWTGLYPFEKFEFALNFGLGRKLGENMMIEIRTTNSLFPVRDYGSFTSTVYYPNPIAQFFNKGLYNNIISALLIYKINPKKKSEQIQP